MRQISLTDYFCKGLNLLFSNNTLRRLSFSSGFTRALGKKSKGRLKSFQTTFNSIYSCNDTFIWVKYRLFEMGCKFMVTWYFFWKFFQADIHH
ncbi:hypothetical protein NEIMUCOT_05024 [Neisseria mucosa ATCC 25996]|uniref:Uncharacterized protein n=1 Tax=Neisseria mucosa (strain ATCC 25996 / DSM 4631 / NCTC 10774 / M26) TaxID=546266 RepID=D2ZWM7_NEIM2|nr:hypothetical protein NEIMUCOT_05024 [Neisseria mucosa ATCC 25996]